MTGRILPDGGTRAVPLARVMARLGTGHALEFNRRHRRSGHLYQNRYKAKPVDSEDSFRRVLRYIHLNPLAAGMVPSLDALARWPWTGHAALLGHRDCPFLDARAVLRRFADDPAEARREYALWMAREEDADAAPEPPPAGPLPVQGAPEDLLDPTRLDPTDAQEALRRAGWDLARVIALVCCRIGVDPAALQEGRRLAPVARAREAVAWLAVRRLGIRQVEVARATGVSGQAMTSMLNRAAARGAELRGAFPELVD